MSKTSEMMLVLLIMALPIKSTAQCPSFPLIAFEVHPKNDSIPLLYTDLSNLNFNSAIEFFSVLRFSINRDFMSLFLPALREKERFA
jgi:hypothetical protein